MFSVLELFLLQTENMQLLHFHTFVFFLLSTPAFFFLDQPFPYFLTKIFPQTDIGCMYTYKSQSKSNSSDISSVGSPIVENTITMDTMPACGMPAAPVLTAVTIKLNRTNSDGYVM